MFFKIKRREVITPGANTTKTIIVVTITIRVGSIIAVGCGQIIAIIIPRTAAETRTD